MKTWKVLAEPNAHSGNGFAPFRYIATQDAEWDDEGETLSKGELICSMRDRRGIKGESKLIAAAPDLLAACLRVAEHFKRHGLPDSQGLACDVFNAIDKATK